MKYDPEQRLAALAHGLQIDEPKVVPTKVTPLPKQVKNGVEAKPPPPKPVRPPEPEPEEVQHVPGICDSCGEPIPTKRLQLIPGTKMCAPCQAEAGDVFINRGIGSVEGGQHYGGVVESVVRSFDDWRRVRNLQFSGATREPNEPEEEM